MAKGLPENPWGWFWLRCGSQVEALRKADAAAPKHASLHLLMLCSGLDLTADTPGRCGRVARLRHYGLPRCRRYPT